MIRYDLLCADDHEFDAWFRDRAAFDKQVGIGAVICPQCGSSAVRKAILAPTVTTSRDRAETPVPRRPAETTQDKSTFASLRDPAARNLIELARQLRRHVEANAENVGDKFAEEARLMHYDETDRRSIYGEATVEDTRALLEEGIDIFPLPRLPEDGN